ncbi:GntR family transcriptional regulator [Burkholderiaceae bacterium]|nr:GntR family transcriptional regulator [Burkholderiaceae bacterium]
MNTSTRTRSLVQRVREQIEDDIVEGRLRPGEQLYIDAIAKQYDVSRTPVREAFQQLEASGLVEVMPKKGTYVATISAADLIEMFEVMAELEAMCARLAARRIDAALLADITSAMLQCEIEAEKGAANAYYHANDAFHQLIYRASGNAFLVQQTIHLKNRLKPYRRMQLQVRNRLAHSMAEHRALFAALKSGDEAVSAQAAKSHVLVQGQRFTDLISLLQQRRLQPSDN